MTTKSGRIHGEYFGTERQTPSGGIYDQRDVRPRRKMSLQGRIEQAVAKKQALHFSADDVQRFGEALASKIGPFNEAAKRAAALEAIIKTIDGIENHSEDDDAIVLIRAIAKEGLK